MARSVLSIRSRLPSFSSRATRFHTSGASRQVRLALLNQRRNLLQALDDRAITLIERRVFEHKRIEQRVAHQFDIDRRIVAIALDLVEFQQRQVDLVIDDLVIGVVFGRERILWDRSQPGVEIRIELSLLVDARRAEIVDLFIQFHALVLVITGGCRRGRRKGQRSVDEVISQARKIRFGRRRRRLAAAVRQRSDAAARSDPTLCNCRIYFLQVLRFTKFGAFQLTVDISEQTSEYSTGADFNEAADTERSQLLDYFCPAHGVRNLLI